MVTYGNVMYGNVWQREGERMNTCSYTQLFNLIHSRLGTDQAERREAEFSAIGINRDSSENYQSGYQSDAVNIPTKH